MSTQTNAQNTLHSLHPYRSVLYIPASKERALKKAQTLLADAIIFDLEDAVAPDEKEAAREILANALHQHYGKRARIVRINGFDTKWGKDDAKMFADHAGADAILVPKVAQTADLDAVARLVPDKPLWAMMETPAGMLRADEIAAHNRLQCLVMGTNDLAKELTLRFRPDRLGLMSGLGLCLLAAKAHSKVIIDGVYNAFKDDEGLRFECEQGRDMGFDGKTLIHPAQLDIANESFAPGPFEIDLAHRQIAAFNAAIENGEAVAVVDGKIVENLHVATAKAILAKSQAIEEMAKS